MKNNYSDFIKKAYEAGRVKDSSEAFKEYPPEEEWHHGDAISFLGESKTEYLSKYSIGDIVYVKEFLFLDGSVGKNHLFVIIVWLKQIVFIKYRVIIYYLRLVVYLEVMF